MADVPLDFPANPEPGQRYTSDTGVVYYWDGVSWIVNYVDSNTQQFNTVGDILAQVRTLLQDTDLSAHEYRYSTDSLVTNYNMCMWEMYRIRPDIFLANNFQVPQFGVGQLEQEVVIEKQFIPSVVYYIVGMAQLRDNEGDQDERASGFLSKFTSMLVAVA